MDVLRMSKPYVTYGMERYGYRLMYSKAKTLFKHDTTKPL